jgi:hypothetical protein
VSLMHWRLQLRTGTEVKEVLSTYVASVQVTGLSFSAVDPELMYVHGLDYEVFILFEMQTLMKFHFWSLFKASLS